MSSQKQSITFGQWVQHLQYEMRNIQVVSKNAFAHRTKLTYICNQMGTFAKSISTFSMESRTITQDEIDLFQKLIASVTRFSDLIQQQYEKNWINYFIKYDCNHITDEINEIMRDFNDIAIKLNLCEKPPLYWSEYQEKNNIIHDLGILRQLLENADVPNKEERLKEIIDLRQKLSDEIGMDSSKPKLLDPKEIQRSLSSLEQWEIDPDDIKLQRKIASGGFGDVYQGYRVSDETVVAVKRLHNQAFDENGLEMFKSEVAILAKLKHFAILPFVGACTKPPFCIITKYMSGDSLFSRLHAKEESDRLSPTQLSIIALGVAYGMAYLHDQNMVHRDLKSLNILLDADNLPMICDFGMARTKTNNNEMFSGGIGTSQWMAPEVLSAQHYDEKSDVYSYGIIMWEMLTGDVPYRGLRDIQVAMTVINQNNRPKIPKNCPQNLAKFIRLCWHSDPDKRPDFHTIVRVLETGSIVFPGTDLSKFKAYVNQFSTPTTETPEEIVQSTIGIDPNDLTNDQMSKMIQEFKDENKVHPLLSAVQHPQYISMIAQFDIVPILEEKIMSTTDINTRAAIMQLTSILLDDESIMQSFLERGGAKILLDALAKYSASSNPQIVDCLTKVLESEHCIFSVKHLTQIAPLLLSDFSVRLSTIRLINLIIEEHCFDDDSIFTVIIENLLRNAVPEAKSDILLETLDVLIQIIQFEAAKAQLRCVEGPDRIIALLSHEDPDVLSGALRLLQFLFEGTTPKQRTISEFLYKFMSVLQSGDSDIQLDALNAIAMLMDNTLVYKEVSAIDDFSKSFIPCINSEDPIVQVSALRICFAFCSNTITENVFMQLLSDLIKLLKSTTYPAILAAYSISAILASHDPVKVLSDGKDEIKEFIDNSLTLESDLTAPAIRIVGVLAATMTGARILEEWGTMPNVAQLMSSKNDEFARLAVMAMAAMSATIPDSEVMHDSIPQLFDALKDPIFEVYPLVCLSNITVDPRNAIDCAPYIPDLLDCILSRENDGFSIQRAVVTLQRIIINPEAAHAFENEGIPEMFMKCVELLWTSEHAPILFSIIESLTQIPAVCNSLKQLGLVDIIKSKLNECQISDPSRPKFIRIKAMLMNSHSSSDSASSTPATVTQ